MYPPHIEGTWQFSGHWFGSYRLIATDQDIIPVVPEYRDMLCPICEYPEAIHLSLKQPNFPLLYYCPECNIIYGWYVARCPDCDGFIWNKGCVGNMTECSMCGLHWDIETIKEINMDPDFHNEGMEDE